MTTGWRRLAIAAAVFVALAVLWSWWHSPQRRIYRRLDALTDRLERHGEESSLAAVANAQGVVDFFAPGFVARAQPYEGELREPQELAGAVLRFRTGAQRIDIGVSDRRLTLAADKRSGTLFFVAAVTLDRGAGPARETRRVRTLWILDSGNWRIAELELLEPIEGAGALGL
ncbi:MAG TPA: hypothetical protein VGV61_14465 [Thermoanaerobaculia bacterium]|jgi:hypothetical protein|nr:hypothetical protein [Thermoanaerobaculia bacterium]